MGTSDSIFVADSRDTEDLLPWILAATGMSDVTDRNDPTHVVDDDEHYIARQASRGRLGSMQAIVQNNYLQYREQELADLAFGDYFPRVVSTFYNGRDRDYLYSETVNLFVEMSSTALVPMALVRGGDALLIAVCTPADGIYWMPPRTETSSAHRYLWGQFLPAIEAAVAESAGASPTIDGN